MRTEARQRDTVLVVDDCRDELRFLVEALEQAGLTALTATHGEAALTLLERVTPNLVVMDAVMGGLDGFETCRRIKGEPQFAHLPVIFLTGLKDTEHVLAGLAAGGVDYVTKPVIVEELIARIRIHIMNARVAFGARVALDATGRHLLATDRSGRVLWCTPQAATLLAGASASCAPGDIRIPEDISASLGAMISREGHRQTNLPATQDHPEITISFLCEIGPEEILFQLTEPAQTSEEEVLCREFALTSREAEVLSWIARGKPNVDIGEILGISPRTVHKHLEKIFIKLGVENRASATSVALGALRRRI